MRNLLLIAVCCTTLLSACVSYYEDGGESVQPIRTNDYEPVEYARADLDSSIRLLPAQEIVNSGKICVINNFLLVNEERKGFHVFDNSDPRNPSKIKFIQVLGSSDLAVRNNMLYINQATDLIALQYDPLSDKIRLMKRIENAFPELLSPQGYYNRSHKDSLTIDWIEVK